MLKKLFLPLCLLVASSSFAISDSLQSLLTNEAVRVRYEQLSKEQQEAVDVLLAELDAVSNDTREAVADRAAKHQVALEMLQQLLETKNLALTFPLKVVAPEVVAQEETTTVENS